MQHDMKSINLFGQEEHVFTNRGKSQKGLFNDYEGFVEKFKPKKTTDDCYTPPAVYDYVLQYVADHCDIDGMTVVRPFYPGGDYESLVYPDNCVVIDNPPFSIIAQIVRFYLKRGIKFFLFAPHLTLFSADLDCTRIVCGAAIVYENGAKVNTSFLSNMFGEAGVIGDPVLYEGIDAICSAPKAELPKYKYPDCVLMVSDVAYIVKNKGEMRCYVLCGYKGDTFEKAQTRMGEAWRAGFMPMAMLFRDLEGKYSTDWRRFQRQWANPTITICNCIKHFGR